MTSSFFCFLFFIIFYFPLILATNVELASTSVNSPMLQEVPAEEDDCIIVPRIPRASCDHIACFNDGGRCVLDGSQGRCLQRVIIQGLRNHSPAQFGRWGPEACRQCKCARTTALVPKPGVPEPAVSNPSWLRPNAPKPLIRLPADVVGTREQGPGFAECKIKSSPTCKATDCFAAGGRCKVSRGYERCYPHIPLRPRGILWIRHRWGVPGAPPECTGCRCVHRYTYRHPAPSSASSLPAGVEGQGTSSEVGES